MESPSSRRHWRYIRTSAGLQRQLQEELGRQKRKDKRKKEEPPKEDMTFKGLLHWEIHPEGLHCYPTRQDHRSTLSKDPPPVKQDGSPNVKAGRSTKGVEK